MTVHSAIKLIKKWHYNSLNPREKKFIFDMESGLDGMGEVSDVDVIDYMTRGQIQFVWDIGKRFLITKGRKA